jgi:hypothetical protein
MLNKPVIAENCVSITRSARLRAWQLRYKDLLRSDSGSVTVEWVALAAGLVIGTIYVSFIIMQGLVGAASNVASQLSP